MRMLDSALGRAWDVSDCERVVVDQTASKAAWFLLVPSAHPWWPRYLLGVISLEDIPGVAPAHKEYPDAEWELCIYALDPDKGPNPFDRATWYPLTPPNVIVQFSGCSEARAKEVAELAAMAVIDGVLPVEPDDYPGSRLRWNITIRATAACLEH